MYKLLKFEFRRLFLRVSLYICLGVIAVPVLSMFYITGSDYFSKDYNYQITLFGVLQNMIGVANLTTLSVVFTSIFGCEDKARGTIKTIYSLGFPRFKLFLSKFLASATATTIMYFLIVISGVVCGLLFSKEGQSSMLDIIGEAQEEPNIILFIIQQFFVIMGAHAFYYMISELIGKTGLAIVLSIFGPGLVSSFFGIITAIISSVAYKNEKLVETVSQMYFTFLQYWLPTTFSSFSDMLTGGSGVVLWISILVNTGYILLFGGLAMLITYKKQIK